MHIVSRLPTSVIIMHRDLFNVDTSTLRQRFELHHAVDSISEILSGDGAHIYRSMREQLAQTISLTQQSSAKQALLSLDVIILTIKSLHKNLKYLETRENLLEIRTLYKTRECLQEGVWHKSKP
jgi:hypothetical protein